MTLPERAAGGAGGGGGEPGGDRRPGRHRVRAATEVLAEQLADAAHPPVRDARFWLIQVSVLGLAGLHLLVDVKFGSTGGAFPGGIPVALLVIPLGYTALRYGLAASVATAGWATLLWLPDLLLPDDAGHVGADVIDLVLVDFVAVLLGLEVRAGRLARERAEQVSAERLLTAARYRQLFESNRSPILVLDRAGVVRDANPAAGAAIGADPIGRPAGEVVGELPERPATLVTSLADGRDYRIEVVPLPPGAEEAVTQIVLEDVTDERNEGRRATRFAGLLVAAEEAERRRLARELHDEPLQLFLHLARRLERFSQVGGLPDGVAAGLGEARQQAVEAGERLRALARDLRPPALEQLGLIAALSSLLADVEEEHDLRADLAVVGEPRRLDAESELGGFRIVQEAVNNTLRHAAASHVEVTVAFAPDSIELTVRDDGQGFAPDAVSDGDGGHLGLLGMRERANLLGGWVELRSAKGEGTVVTAQLPLRHGARGPVAPGGAAVGRRPAGAAPPGDRVAGATARGG